jgi:hypothetical protein
VKRRINSTGRRRIERRHVAIRLQRMPGHDRPRVDAEFALDELEIDPSAAIVIEAYAKDLAERFAWGTVTRPRPEGIPWLTELPPDGVSFRVKIVDPASHRLLALARRLRPATENEETGGRRELFRVRTVPLGEELWRVVIEDGDAPILELNADVPDVRARFHEPIFRAAILPAAMRTVLLALSDDEEDQDDDPDSWSQRWFRFAGDLAGDPRPGSDDPEGIRNWIDRACSRFAERFSLVSDMVAAVERRSDL